MHHSVSELFCPVRTKIQSDIGEKYDFKQWVNVNTALLYLTEATLLSSIVPMTSS